MIKKCTETVVHCDYLNVSIVVPLSSVEAAAMDITAAAPAFGS